MSPDLKSIHVRHLVPVSPKEHEFAAYSDQFNREILEYRNWVNRLGLKRVWPAALHALSLRADDAGSLLKMIGHLMDVEGVTGFHFFANHSGTGDFIFQFGFVLFDCESFDEGLAKAVLVSEYEHPRWEKLRAMREEIEK